MSSVALQINQSRLMMNLKLAFSNKSIVLAELAQNARRANSSLVRFTHDAEAQTLLVEDEGYGIDDLQNLLTVAESGWDEETRQMDSPYGMGFLSTMFAAESIEVSSCNQSIVLNCQSVLEGYPASVVADVQAPAKGARIVLHGFRMKPEDLKKKMAALAIGFPIEVIFNGESLKRPLANNGGRTFVQSGIGLVSVAGIHHGTVGREGHERRVFLQGVEIGSLRRGNGFGHETVIHLDATGRH